jgi:hypothetical protein
MSGAHATKQEIDEFFKHTKSHAANKVRSSLSRRERVVREELLRLSGWPMKLS